MLVARPNEVHNVPMIMTGRPPKRFVKALLTGPEETKETPKLYLYGISITQVLHPKLPPRHALILRA
jgi:hypothetical protein